LSILTIFFYSQTLVDTEARLKEQVGKLQTEKQDAVTQNTTLLATLARLETQQANFNGQVQTGDVVNQQIRDLEARMYAK
jgi:peptidoglycan hydrolase CwlO-like protein